MIFVANWKHKQSSSEAQKFIKSLEKATLPKSAKVIILEKTGVKYCLVGHSDFRKQGESEKDIAEKIANLTENKITPLLCFSKENQIKPYLNHKNIIFCFEPTENISKDGKFKKINTAQVEKRLRYFRKMVGSKATLLYGGSVNQSNAQELAKIPHLDGFLVGQASLKYKSFIQLIDET